MPVRRPRRGPGGAWWEPGGSAAGPGVPALVRARHFSASWAKLGGNATSAFDGDAPVTSPASAAAYDAVVVGAGPNGLTAAALLAAAGRSVLLLEAAEKVGGGASTEELTLPGYWHDVCSAIHPLAAGSPAFAPLALERHGLELAHPEFALAHPLDDGSAGVLDRGFTATDASLGADAARWRSTFAPHARGWDDARRRPVGTARARAPPPASARRASASRRSRRRPPFARRDSGSREPRALFSGMAAHAMLPLTPSGDCVVRPRARRRRARGRVARDPRRLATDQRRARGHRARATAARSSPVRRCRACRRCRPPRRVPRHEPVRRAHHRRRPSLRDVDRALARFERGPAAFKLDYALSEPVPWTGDRLPPRRHVHLGGSGRRGGRGRSRGRRAATTRTALRARRAAEPVRPDARAGRPHTLWAYCHVPNGSTVDMTERIEAQLERFAPGFRTWSSPATHSPPRTSKPATPTRSGATSAAARSRDCSSCPRPRLAVDPYRLADGVYLCSASTPPGAGVHGMSAAAAVQRALRRELRA